MMFRAIKTDNITDPRRLCSADGQREQHQEGKGFKGIIRQREEGRVVFCFVGVFCACGVCLVFFFFLSTVLSPLSSNEKVNQLDP